MVRLRLQRLGRRNRPFYRLNAIEKRNRRNGKVLEQLGWYDPVASDPEKQLSLDGERIAHWLSVGALPSETVADLLAKNDLLPEKLKAQWEADRTTARNRVDARKAVTTAEAAVAALGTLTGDTEADISGHVSTANDALKDAKAKAGRGEVQAALDAAAKAEAALAAAKQADEDAKAAKAKAEADAKAAESDETASE
jgi:small subunit ribosomal protein S16